MLFARGLLLSPQVFALQPQPLVLLAELLELLPFPLLLQLQGMQFGKSFVEILGKGCSLVPGPHLNS